MTSYWPRRAAGLPPGQRLLDSMPRFGIEPHKAPPPVSGDPNLEITVEREPVAVLSAADLEALGPREYQADFHCVTTWSVTGLIWTGVPLLQALAGVSWLWVGGGVFVLVGRCFGGGWVYYLGSAFGGVPVEAE